MFTMKFYRAPPDEGKEAEIISCARYSIIEGINTYIWMYSTLKKENGTIMELHKEEEDNVYYEAFVENSAGKTIARYRAWEA